MTISIPDTCPYCRAPDCGVAGIGCAASREASCAASKKPDDFTNASQQIAACRSLVSAQEGESLYSALSWLIRRVEDIRFMRGHLKFIHDFEKVEAQHEETGYLWRGRRAEMPGRYVEIANEFGITQGEWARLIDDVAAKKPPVCSACKGSKIGEQEYLGPAYPCDHCHGTGLEPVEPPETPSGSPYGCAINDPNCNGADECQCKAPRVGKPILPDSWMADPSWSPPAKRKVEETGF